MTRPSVSFGLPIMACLLGMPLTFVNCTGSPEARCARHLASGKKLLAAKDYARAILEFRNAASAMLRNPEPLYELGLAYVATGNASDFQVAVKSFSKALELDPKHAGARLELARLMALTRDKSTLADAERRMRALMSDTGATAEKLNVLAMTELKLGKPGEAAQDLELALSLAPEDFSSAALLATAKLAQRDGAGAEEVLRKAIASSPGSPDAIILLGRVYAFQKQLTQAAAAFQRALDISPKNQTALMFLGETQLALNRNQEAEQTFRRLTSLDEKDSRQVYGLFLFQQGRRQEAVLELERLAKEDPKDRGARTRLVAAYQAVNRLPDARKVLDAALAKNPKDLDALVQRSELLILDGKYNQAELDLNQVLRLNPGSAEVHYIFAKLHQARRADLSYRQELTEALRIQPFALGVRLELAQSLLSANAARPALQLLDEAPESQRRSLDLLAERNWALWGVGDLPAMRKGIDLGLGQQRSPEFLTQEGYWKGRTRDLSGAVAAFEAALKLDPGRVKALDGLTQAYFAQNKRPEGLQKAKAYAALSLKSAAVQQFVGKLLMANGDRTGARTALNAAKAAAPQSHEADLLLAQLDMLDNKPDDAAARLRVVVSSDPRNSAAYLLLGVLAETKGDHSAAEADYRRAIEGDPHNAAALNNLAFELSEYDKKAAEALPFAQQAKELAPDRPEFADTLGWILYRKGLYDSAVRQLESAAAQKEASVTIRYHLAMAYLKMGDRVRGKAALEAALKQNPNVPEAESAKEMLARTK